MILRHPHGFFKTLKWQEVPKPRLPPEATKSRQSTRVPPLAVPAEASSHEWYGLGIQWIQPSKSKSPGVFFILIRNDQLLIQKGTP